MIATLILAAALPAIFAGIPEHRLPATTVAAKPHTFFENIVSAPDGSLYVTSLDEGVVYRFASEKLAPFARIEGRVAGIVREPSGSFVVGGWGRDRHARLWRVDAQGHAHVVARPAGMQFPNGIVALDTHRYLIADSYAGAIWLLDTRGDHVSLWLRHPLLARSTPAATFPAVNGLKLFRGTLYASNTQQQLFLAIPITTAGNAGTPAIRYRRVNFDDFVFTADGTLYATTHVYNSLIRIRPNGARDIVAGLADGMAGDTAAAFGADGLLYVTTNGGLSVPPPGGVQPGRLVRLRLSP